MRSKRTKLFNGIGFLTMGLMGFVVLGNWVARADILNQSMLDPKQEMANLVIVAQNETKTSTQDKTAGSSDRNELESLNQEKKKSAEATPKPIKDFSPSEKIEADQVVDFPYDI